MLVVVSLMQDGMYERQLFHVPEGQIQVIVDSFPVQNDEENDEADLHAVTVVVREGAHNHRVVQFDSASSPALNVTVSVISEQILDMSNYGLEGFELIDAAMIDATMLVHDIQTQPHPQRPTQPPLPIFGEPPNLQQVPPRPPAYPPPALPSPRLPPPLLPIPKRPAGPPGPLRQRPFRPRVLGTVKNASLTPSNSYLWVSVLEPKNLVSN